MKGHCGGGRCMQPPYFPSLFSPGFCLQLRLSGEYSSAALLRTNVALCRTSESASGALAELWQAEERCHAAGSWVISHTTASARRSPGVLRLCALPPSPRSPSALSWPNAPTQWCT